MSLNITVGLLTDMEEDDAEIVQEEFHFLKEVNEALRERGLPEHVEPATLPEGFKSWNASVGSESLEDLLNLAISVAETQGREPAELFPHLVGAQCNYYLPIDLPEPLLFELEDEEADEDYDEEFGMEDEEESDEEDEEFLIGVGSSLLLKKELEAVAEATDLPLDRFPIDYSGEGGVYAWDSVFAELQEQNAKCVEYENASRALINLYHACLLSVENNMAVCLG